MPEGDYTLKVTYVGYADFSDSVSVGSDGVVLDVSLNVDYVALEGVNVTGLAQGQAKALSQQRSAGNIKNVVSRDQMEKFHRGDHLSRKVVWHNSQWVECLLFDSFLLSSSGRPFVYIAKNICFS